MSDGSRPVGAVFPALSLVAFVVAAAGCAPAERGAARETSPGDWPVYLG